MKVRSLLAIAGMPLITCLLSAQETAPYQPRLTNNKGGGFQDFPMGVLSATGRLADGEREILVIDVGKGGAAEQGGLRAEDRIVSIGGRKCEPFSKSTETGVAGPQTDLAVAIEAACAADKSELKLEVRRADKTIALVIPVPKSPAFAASFPEKCPKRKEYLAGIAAHLLATQRNDGSWQPGVGGDADVYMSAFCTLALLAADEEKSRPAIVRALGFLQRKSISQTDPKNPKGGPKNWQAATTAMLLAEYQLATGDKTYHSDLTKCCDFLAARVTANGTMGHHFEIPYNGGGLVIINTQAHLAWALAAKCEYKIDQAAWDRSFKEVRGSIDQKTGAIGYSSRAAWSPDIPARTGAMAAALAIAGKEPKLARQFADSLVKHQGRMRHAHAMSSIGLIYGFAGLRLASPAGHQEVMRKWMPYLELCRNASGSAAYFGGKRNIGGDEYLGLEPIGNATVALVLASPEGKLFLHGGTKQGWFGAGSR